MIMFKRLVNTYVVKPKDEVSARNTRRPRVVETSVEP
jgi:hypothetical protein